MGLERPFPSTVMNQMTKSSLKRDKLIQLSLSLRSLPLRLFGLKTLLDVFQKKHIFWLGSL